MGNYSSAAAEAAIQLANNHRLSPAEAWQYAVEKTFPGKVSSQRKGCPKNAFLALAELGIMSGTKVGTYTNSIANKRYTLRALEAVRKDASLISRKSDLWRLAIGDETKAHNGQMDVLIGLIKAKHLLP